MNRMITQEEVKQSLNYDPATGVFTSLKTGKIVGSLAKTGYVLVYVGPIQYLAHRVAFVFMGEDMPINVDHINHDRADNRWCNLRRACPLTNQRNRRKSKNNSSGVTGVSESVMCGKPYFIAQIQILGKHVHLYAGRCKNSAIAARKDAEKTFGFHENHGE